MSVRFRFRPFCSLAVFLAVTFFEIAVALAGEPQWVEVRSPNFSVVTDAGERRGREVAMRFEQMRGVFGALMTKANVNLPVPLQIVAFRNTKEMRQVAPLFNGKPTQLAGLFQGGSDCSFIMLDMSVEDPWVVVFHEYAHQLMNGTLQAEFAPWFEEGFAMYFSSIEVDNKEARVGKISHDEYVILQQLGTMKIADLFRVQQNSSTYNESGDHRSTFYAQSGMLMHYIYDNQIMSKVAVYFELHENKHLPVEDAIQQAFGMSAAQFDRALSSYISSGHYRYYAIPTPAKIVSNSYTVTPLSATAGSTVVADIHLHSYDYQEQALKEFRDILKSDPNNAVAYRGLGYAHLQKGDFSQAAEYLKRASQLDSKDPQVHYYNALLMARQDGVSREADLATMTKELESSISLDPNFADSYALLALAQSGSGDPAKAIATMQKALAISPRNETYLFNLAHLYLAARQPDQAIALLRSLQASPNPELASRAAEQLALAQQVEEMGDDPGVSITPRLVVRSNHQEETVNTPAKMPVLSGPAQFVKGMLTNIDCSTPPLATLTVLSGTKTWKMKVADTDHITLIGTDEFSCAWSKKKVALNYYPTSEGEGNVVSLEIQ